jgi:hypothetical protein
MENEICSDRSFRNSFGQDQERRDAFYVPSKQGEQTKFFIGKIHAIVHLDSAELGVSIRASLLGRLDFAWTSPEKVLFQHAKSNLGLIIFQPNPCAKEKEVGNGKIPARIRSSLTNLLSILSPFSVFGRSC